MDEDKAGDTSCSGHHEGNVSNPPARNISTAPAFTTSSLLEAVIEEDENSARSQQADQSADKNGYEEDAEDEEELKKDKDVSPSSPDMTSQSRQEVHTGKFRDCARRETSASRGKHSAGKTISRASSRKSRASRQESSGSKVAGSDSESDTEDTHQRDSRGRGSDLDILTLDIANEKDLDTDLETEEAVITYDHSGKTTYVEACKKYGVVPASYFLRHMNDSYLSMKHHGLAGDGMKAIASSLVSNATINTLDLSDNWLGNEGGLAVCEMLKENCFITDLDLSDNHLHLCAEHLCDIIEQNDTLRKVNLSGNGFDDQCAVHIADLIMNTTKLEHLDLSHNNLGEKSGLLLGPAISENLCLKELDLSWNHLRGKGAVAVATGIKTNVYMKKINLSWNGFGLEGSTGLMDALKANNVLLELDISNNRITTEGAVLIGKGLTINETLRVLKMGKNPMQSAGCWGIAAAIKKNPSCVLETLDFSDVLVNKDFIDLWQQVEEQYPNLQLTTGGTMYPKKMIVDPLVKLINYMNSHNIKLVDFFKQFDKDGNMSVSREDFKQGIESSGISLTVKELEILLDELDASGSGAISYSSFDNQTEMKGKENRRMLRPMTS